MIRLFGIAFSTAILILATTVALSQTAESGPVSSGQDQTLSQPQSGSSPQSGSQNQQTGETQAPQTTDPVERPVIDSTPARSSYYDRLRERPWFSDRGVREQLAINDPQFDQLNRAYSMAWRRYNQNVRGLGNDLSEERRVERMRALRDDFERDFSSRRDETIRDERLRSRYNQLYNQYRGYETFDDSTVQSQFKLTPQQRRRLNQYNARWSREMGDIDRLYSSDPEGATERYRELQAQARERLGTVFTPEQRRQWNDFTGEPYDYPPTAYFARERAERNTARPESTRANPQ